MSTGRPPARLPVDLRLRRRLWAERLPAHRRVRRLVLHWSDRSGLALQADSA